ncbi:MAG: chloride channel protein [Candidatus Neomarinimicrobiota bacterium]|nr:MAG: chloride channel protein [Candidatus Neomarinimicrobiota bacterium]
MEKMETHPTINRLFSKILELHDTRMVGFSILVGIIGAVASLSFTYLTDFMNFLFLNFLAHVEIPDIGEAGAVSPLVYGDYGRWLIPVSVILGALISGWVVYQFAPETEGHGTDAVVNAYHNQGGRIRARVPFVKMISAAITIGSGGSAGREGPTAQITAGVGSILAGFFRLSDRDRRMIILAGMAAGLSAMFRSPFGTAIFAVEILYSTMEFEARMLIYTIIASVTAYALNGMFLGWKPIFHIDSDLLFHDPRNLIWFTALGLITGLLGSVFPTVFYRIRDWFSGLSLPQNLRPALGGALLGILALFLPQVLGGGYGWMQMALNGHWGLGTLVILIVAKAVAMSLTIGSGGSGGVFAPSLYVGTMTGIALATVLNQLFPGLGLNIQVFGVVGMAALFASAARVPVASLMMALEMTGGYQLIVPTMMAVAVSYLVQSALTFNKVYPTLYEAQVKDRSESPVHQDEYIARTLYMLKSNQLRFYRGEVPFSLSLQDILKWRTPIRLQETEQYFYVGFVRNKPELVNRPLKQTDFANREIRLIVLIRDGIPIIPNGDTILKPKDKVILVARPEDYESIKTIIRIPYLMRRSTPARA